MLIEKHNVGISSNRVLNLVYTSNSDLPEETSPLLAESRSPPRQETAA